VLVAAGCGKSENSRPAPKAAAAPKPTVAVIRPQRHNIGYSFSRPGYIEAYEHTAIYAKIPGYVDKVNVDSGDKVDPKGKPLAELSVPEMWVELAQKDALVKQAGANLNSAQAKVKAAQAGVLRAQADVKHWDLEQRRLARLVAKGSLDQQNLDANTTQLEASRAAEAEARAQVIKAEADVGVAQQNVKVAEANKDYVATLLQYARLTAPYTGVVVKRIVNTGDFVQPAAGSGTKGEPLFVLARTDMGLRAFVDVPEAAAPWITEKTKALIHPRALPGVEVEGQVTRSAWALDPNARTLRTEVHVKEPGELRPGMFATITLKTFRPNVWTLPVSAVVVKDSDVYCLRVIEGKVVRTPVQAGLNDGKRIEVLRIQIKPDREGEKKVWADFTGKEPIIQQVSDQLTDGEEVAVSSPKRKEAPKDISSKILLAPRTDHPVRPSVRLRGSDRDGKGP
jgi:multidrug resistance efflux pump